MRELSFKGFLRQYVKELSYCGTNNIRQLAKEVPNGNYRLVEPLVLYALSTNKDGYLQRVAEDSFLLSESFRFYDMNFCDVTNLLEKKNINNTDSMPFNYIKAYQSFVLFRDKQKNQNHSKTLRRNRINKLRLQKNISIYRIYTDLKLNHGNVHNYLKNGNVSGVGWNTVNQILEYVKT